MSWVSATENPAEPGWYAVRIRWSDRPLVLWWHGEAGGWRHGAQQVEAVQWLGPL